MQSSCSTWFNMLKDHCCRLYTIFFQGSKPQDWEFELALSPNSWFQSGIPTNQTLNDTGEEYKLIQKNQEDRDEV